MPPGPKTRTPLPTEGKSATAVAEALARLSRLHPRSIDLSLDRVFALLAALDNPQERLPPVVHVAGTNGKGSVIAYMRAGLEAAGRRVHVYTSPHLVRFNERIRLAGRLIGDDVLLDCLTRCEAANDGRPLTFFEATTVAAFVAFSETPADAVLLETGLGGRLDATNVLRQPALTAITPLALDHQDYLGADLAGIAREKAGIMRRGVSCVLAPQPEALMTVLREEAAAKGAEVVEQGRDWTAMAADGMEWRDGERRLRLPSPALAGAHQPQNAGLALTCLNRLPGLPMDDAAMAAALTRVDWPARLQRLESGSLPGLLPPGSTLWLDGGHNPAAAEALADTLATEPPGPMHIVLGMLKNRDPRAFLAPFARLAPTVWAVPIAGQDNAHSATELAERVGPACQAEDVPAALAAIAATGKPAPRVLICGSLYLAGEVLKLNGTPPE